VLHAHGEGGEVHHGELLLDRLGEAQALVAGGLGVLLRVGGVDAVDLGGLEDGLGAELDAAQAGAGVGGEERVAGAGDQDDDASLLEVPQGARG
jgi:hypothetical protein